MSCIQLSPGHAALHVHGPYHLTVLPVCNTWSHWNMVMVSRPSIPSSPHNRGRCCGTLCLFWNRSSTVSGLWSLVLSCAAGRTQGLPGVLPTPVKDRYIGRQSNWKDVISVWITIMTALQLNRKPSDHLTVQKKSSASSAFESQLIQLTATKNHL